MGAIGKEGVPAPVIDTKRKVGGKDGFEVEVLTPGFRCENPKCGMRFIVMPENTIALGADGNHTMCAGARCPSCGANWTGFKENLQGAEPDEIFEDQHEFYNKDKEERAAQEEVACRKCGVVLMLYKDTLEPATFCHACGADQKELPAEEPEESEPLLDTEYCSDCRAAFTDSHACEVARLADEDTPPEEITGTPLYELYNTETEEVSEAESLSAAEAEERNEFLRQIDEPVRWVPAQKEDD